MGRKSKNSERIETRVKAGDWQKLASMVIDLGYCYTREGVEMPLWSAWLEAIADGEILLYKKVSQKVDNQE